MVKKFICGPGTLSFFDPSQSEAENRKIFSAGEIFEVDDATAVVRQAKQRGAILEATQENLDSMGIKELKPTKAATPAKISKAETALETFKSAKEAAVNFVSGLSEDQKTETENAKKIAKLNEAAEKAAKAADEAATAIGKKFNPETATLED